MPGAFYTEDLKRDIAERFVKIKTVNQFASLLNYIQAKKEEPNAQLKKLSSRDLHFLAISKNSRYTEFTISKKNGNKRIINSPDNYLNRVQSLINILFQIIFEEKVHYNTNGFLINRDIVRNAKPHINKRFLLNIDIENYFPSINFGRIKTVLQFSPFNLRDDKEKIGFVIANICTQNGVLPQGAPTSPIISNIVTQKLDRKIAKLCNNKRIKYSRYADDLSFSSNNEILDSTFLDEVASIIESEGFKLNKSKTRLRTSQDRQQVTGIIVNQKLNVNRQYIQKTRAMLNNWSKGGAEYAQKTFNQHYTLKGKGSPDFRNVLFGYISFIGLVRGKDDELYNRLVLKFGLLKNRINYELIDNEQVKAKLIKDNERMEMILLDKIHSPEDKFISFCTAAFYQIENLINFFYWKRFRDISELLQFLFDNNPAFKKRWNSIERIKGFKKISDLDINVLIYLFEKEFYFDKGIFYNQEITMLREIRNDDSHRCVVSNFNSEQIFVEYERLKLKWETFKEKHKRFPEKPKDELEVELKYKLLKFLEAKNYKIVRSTLIKVTKQISEYKFS